MHRGRLQLAFTCLTAFMLLARLVLTVGHPHLSGSHDGYAAHATESASGYGAIELGPDGYPQHPSDHDEKHCALCWAQAVAGGLLVSDAIPLPAPRAMLAEQLAPSAGHLAGQASSRAFQPRAPPHSAA